MKINRRRIAFMLLGNVLCGVSVAMFRMAGFGIDPFNLGVMGLWTLSGLFDYGTFYMILSLTLLAVDFFFLDKKKLGVGTVANMFLVGYVIEFASWIFEQIFPSHGIIVRMVFLILGLLVLCFSSALYYVADLGVSPYDAIPLTIAERSGCKFKMVRVTADCIWVVIGLLGKQMPGAATILIAFCLGPLIEAFHPVCRRMLEHTK